MSESRAEFEYLIVGAGVAGRSLAGRLSEAGRREGFTVALVDEDPTLVRGRRGPDAPGSWQALSEPQPSLNGRQLRLRPRIEAMLSEGAESWHALCLQAAGQVGIALQLRGGSPTDAAPSTDFMDAVACFPDTLALRILFEGKRATGIDAVRGKGAPLTLRARREVVLCGGALRTPHLLQVSGVGDGAQVQKASIRFKHHLPGVGRQLQDVLGVDLQRSLRRSGLFEGSAWTAWRDEWRERLQARRRPLVDARFGLPLTDGRDAAPEATLRCRVALGRWLRVTLLLQFALSQPASRGELRPLGPDPRSAALIDPRYLSHEDDLERLVAAHRFSERWLQAPALASRLRRPEPAISDQTLSGMVIREFIRDQAHSLGRFAGSCQMGTDEASVVDAQFRVHGLQGLRVADASVWATPPQQPGTGPLRALAAEAAAQLLSA